MVTIKDIAERLGISISTVSKGLHGASDISEDMRQQVLDTAIEMGYVIKEKKPAARQKVCIIVENMEYANINQFGYEREDRDRIVVEVLPLTNYVRSADEHQHHLERYPEDCRLCSIPDEILNKYRHKQNNGKI